MSKKTVQQKNPKKLKNGLSKYHSTGISLNVPPVKVYMTACHNQYKSLGSTAGLGSTAKVKQHTIS